MDYVYESYRNTLKVSASNRIDADKLLRRFDIWYLFETDTQYLEVIVYLMGKGWTDKRIQTQLAHMRSIDNDKIRLKHIKIASLINYLNSKRISRRNKSYISQIIIKLVKGGIYCIDEREVDILTRLNYSTDEIDRLVEVLTTTDVKIHNNSMLFRYYMNPSITSAHMQLIRAMLRCIYYSPKFEYVVDRVSKLNISRCNLLEFNCYYYDNEEMHPMNIIKSMFSIGISDNIIIKYIETGSDFFDDRINEHVLRYISLIISPQKNVNIMPSSYIDKDPYGVNQIRIGGINGLSDDDISLYKNMKTGIHMYLARLLLEHGKSLDDYAYIFKENEWMMNYSDIIITIAGLFNAGYTVELVMEYLKDLSIVFAGMREILPNLSDKDILEVVTYDFTNRLEREFVRFKIDYWHKKSPFSYKFYTYIGDIVMYLFIGYKSGLSYEDLDDCVEDYANKRAYSWRDSYKNNSYGNSDIRFIINKKLSKLDIKSYGLPQILFVK